MFLRFIDSTALLSIKWTMQKLTNIDRTHLVLQASATEKDWEMLICLLQQS